MTTPYTHPADDVTVSPEPPTSALDREPVVIILSAAGALVAAGLVAANALGVVTLDAKQVGSIVAFVALVAAVLIAAIRGQVWSSATHWDLMARALELPPPAPPIAVPHASDTIGT